MISVFLDALVHVDFLPWRLVHERVRLFVTVFNFLALAGLLGYSTPVVGRDRKNHAARLVYASGHTLRQLAEDPEHSIQPNKLCASCCR
jgi:hypothetical protein